MDELFKAKQRTMARDVVSLDPELDPEQLLAWARAGQLVCPECSAEVGYRRAGVKRAHFYHKARLDCDYGHEDPEVLAARAALYTFLVEKVRAKGGTIDIERRLPGAPPDDIVDVWLELPDASPVAYRIFAKGPRTRRFEEIGWATRRQKVTPRYLLCISRRTWEDPGPATNSRRLLVPAYDRNLFFRRNWDKYYLKQIKPQARPYDCLLYIDPEREAFVQYRNIRQPGDCNPNVHVFDQEQIAPISQMLILKDGEFVFPDEAEQKAHWESWKKGEEERQAEEARKQHERDEQDAKRIAEWRASQAAKAPEYRAGIVNRAVPVVTPAPTPIVRDLVPRETPTITCSTCGKVTRDHWLDNGDGTGECRACLFRKRGVEPMICRSCGAAYHPVTSPLVDGRCRSCRG